MKALFFLFSTIVLAGGLLLAGEQPAQETEACQFALSGEPAEPTITGPDNVVPLVHIIAQPDSPIEIVSIDFQGTFLSIVAGNYTWEPRCKATILNRSDQSLYQVDVAVRVRHPNGGIGGGLGMRNMNLAPGQETEITGCGGRGWGHTANNQVRILVNIERVDFESCRYYPSVSLPKNQRVQRWGP